MSPASAIPVPLPLALMIVWFALFAVENRRGNRAWEAYQTEADTRGLKLKMADYIPAPIPDEENFAMTPLFQNTFRRQAGEKMERPSIREWFRPVGSNEPMPPMGEALDLVKWRDYLVSSGNLEKAGDIPAEDILLALAKADPELLRLREAAQRPKSRFPVQWADVWNTAQPHLTECLFAFQLLQLRVVAELSLEKKDEALADVMLMFRLDEALDKELTLIAALVRLTSLIYLQTTIRCGLAGHQWRDTDLRHIQAKLAGPNLLAAYHHAMNSERAFMILANEQFLALSRSEQLKRMQQLEEGAKLTDGILSKNADKQLTASQTNVLPDGLHYLNLVKTNQYIDACLSRIDPVAQLRRAGTGPEDIVASVSGSDWMLYYYSSFRQTARALQAFEPRFLYAHTRQQQAILACALERFYLARNSYPEKLADLVPEYIGGLPNDVRDGQVMRYAVEADRGSYQLWGIGMDGADEQGRQIPNTPSDHKPPDWLWTMPKQP